MELLNNLWIDLKDKNQKEERPVAINSHPRTQNNLERSLI